MGAAATVVRLRVRASVSADDRQQRLNLGSLGRVHRAEVHYRVGRGCYEGMAWEHLVMHLIQSRHKTQRAAIKSRQNIFWDMVVQRQRVGKSMGLQQRMTASIHLFGARKERRKRQRVQKQFLMEEEWKGRESNDPPS